MSWLDLNHRFTNFKGQISNLANSVLADDITDSGIANGDLEELQRLCVSQREEIERLKKLNGEKSPSSAPSSIPPSSAHNNEEHDRGSNWGWNVDQNSSNDSLDKEVAALRLRIIDLEGEKRDLIRNLELLDADCQQNTEKLVAIKDKLQNDYNELEDNYSKLKDDNVRLINARKKDKRELEQVTLQLTSLSSAAANNNKTEGICSECDDSRKDNQALEIRLEEAKHELELLKSNSKTLSQLLDDTNTEVGALNQKLKLFESENKILVKELKKANETIAKFENQTVIDEENCKRLADMLEGYEQQLRMRDDELVSLKNALKDAHKRYVTILADSVRKFVDSDSGAVSVEIVDPQLADFSTQVEKIMKILDEFRTKTESLESQVFNLNEDKTNLLNEKNHEIEKLLQNSEVLSQEVITKSQTIKDYENECNELIKNNDILIGELEMYKNNTGLQTISESHEDNLLLLENQLEIAKKRIEQLEIDLTKSKDKLDEQELSSELVEVHFDGNLDELRDENQALRNKIEHLEEEQDVSLLEKEKLINAYDKVKADLENTEYQYTEMHINMEALKEEAECQRTKIEDLIEINSNLEKLNLEYERTNEDVRTELNSLREKLSLEEDLRKQFENQVRHLTEKLQNAKMTETTLKLQYDALGKELAGALDAKTNLELILENTLGTLEQCQKNFDAIQVENDDLRLQLEESKQTLPLQTSPSDVAATETSRMAAEERDDLLRQIEELTHIKNQHLQCAPKVAFLEKTVEELNSAKDELTNVVITKHQENVTYHNEIQRLSQILTSEIEKSRLLENQLQSSLDGAKFKEDLEKLRDQNAFLRQKTEVLALNLLDEQKNVQSIANASSEKELALGKKLERLQSHLIELEQHYTDELLKAEEKNAELQVKVNEIQQREKSSSTMYTSVSIRANQHVETLQNQLQLITNQRDELRKKISEAEDHAGKQAAALSNLQFVLEQFQKDKENDVRSETERIRRQIAVEKKTQEELREEIRSLQCQLQESKHGLLAASRLSDQLEQSKQLASTLKAEVSSLKEKLMENEDQMKAISSQTDGKVDKSLVKNLIIGFVTTNNNLTKDQTQILRIIATVLDFNQQDRDKIDLNKSHQGWLGSILSPSGGMSHESLSQAFVKFLENESKPRVIPSLLGNNNNSTTSSASSVTSSRKSSSNVPPRNSPIVLSEVVLPTFADFAQTRNSSSILKDVLKDNS